MIDRMLRRITMVSMQGRGDSYNGQCADHECTFIMDNECLEQEVQSQL